MILSSQTQIVSFKIARATRQLFSWIELLKNLCYGGFSVVLIEITNTLGKVHIYLSVYLCIYLFIYLSTYLYLDMICMLLYLSIYVCICISISIYTCIYICIYHSISLNNHNKMVFQIEKLKVWKKNKIYSISKIMSFYCEYVFSLTFLCDIQSLQIINHH